MGFYDSFGYMSDALFEGVSFQINTVVHLILKSIVEGKKIPNHKPNRYEHAWLKILGIHELAVAVPEFVGEAQKSYPGIGWKFKKNGCKSWSNRSRRWRFR